MASTKQPALSIPSTSSPGPEIDSQVINTSLQRHDTEDHNSSTLHQAPVILESQPTDSNQHESSVFKCTNEKPRSKRSSSSSNDVLHERDRFRARFQSMNPISGFSPGVLTEDQASLDEPKLENCPTSKTKKLSSTHLVDPLVLELLDKYSLSVVLSPLDSDSTFFKNCLEKAPIEINPLQNIDIYKITLSQLSTVFKWYFNKPLPPTQLMFPWLHGLHPANYTQRSFFMCQQQVHSKGGSLDYDISIPKPKDARFLMCIEGAPSTADNVLRNTVGINEVLKKIEYSKNEVHEIIHLLILGLFPEAKNDKDFLHQLVNTIVSDCLDTGFMPSLLNLDPDRGISLRNFHIQVAKLAQCSDFIVYHPHDSSKQMSIARLLRLAQKLEERESGIKNHVFLLEDDEKNVDDTFKIFVPRETNKADNIIKSSKTAQLFFNSYTHFKNHHVPPWDAGFQLREKLESSVMSSASRVHNNVWLGNIWDHEIMSYYLRCEPEKAKSIVNEICMPKIPTYCDPKKSSLLTEELSIDNFTSFLSLPKAQWRLFVHCHNDARFPDASELSRLLFKYTISSHNALDVEEYHHLDFPSSGSIGLGDCKQENLMCIVNTCKLLYLYSSTVTSNSIASLIYCSDGYTELSLLIFCYMMYAENLPLNEAMIKVHRDCGRPFYIFGSDVIILRKLELLLRKFSPKNNQASIEWSKQETINPQEINEVLLGVQKPRMAKSIPSKLRLGYIANDLDAELSESLSESEEDELDGSDGYLSRSWVEDAEGSFPSRILPYLYLGSLKHADSLPLLSKIGIKKVISVGENLTWLHGHKFQDKHDVILEEANNGQVENYSILPRPFCGHKSSHQCSVRSVMKVNNLQDDGIDELANALPSILESIDEEYRSKGEDTKILVHCRVGVSRSATVVIAEVMRRLGLDLPSAYLFVRVRRLNIVIQPNLRFMYELFKWEESAKEKTESGESTVLRKMDWFMMCREIERLNLPFLTNRFG